ncbi:MAG: AraC family transcriptional regulator [Bacteroides sp.]|nr:AraC family transcriptional regulator [Roseburia sp.]MCM1347742.1 AraC family transcriptional regulator [Bacteroides sp.]MCM1420050.1 AraC family transcriptional regulator [Bacteroides sp.]
MENRLTNSDISTHVFHKEQIKDFFASPINADRLFACIVTKGCLSATINYKTYPVCATAFFMVLPGRIFRVVSHSDDIEICCLSVSIDYISKTDSTDMISRRTKYGVRFFSQPIIPIDHTQCHKIMALMQQVSEAREDTENLYRNEIVLCHINIFYLHISHIIDSYYLHQNHDKANTLTTEQTLANRNEKIIDSFINLLIKHFREEHKVDFYADKLNISSHHLTLIIKKITGQSVSELIYEMLYSEARTLLHHSNLSIQEIAVTLHFSDQSAFRKFFLRRAGITPKKFR